jgi:hypothetical protein
MPDDKDRDKECGGRGKIRGGSFSPVKIVVFCAKE